MKRFLAAIMSVAVVATVAPVVDAQTQCPAEVSQAQAMLKKVSKAQDVQAPRSLAGAKSSSGSDAVKLVREAEAACKAGNMDAAKAKAVEAMGLMK